MSTTTTTSSSQSNKKSTPRRSSRTKPSTPTTSTTPKTPISDPTKKSRLERIKQKVRFSSVDVLQFKRRQARDKVPSDGAAPLGLGEKSGPTLTKRLSQFELERKDSGRSPAKLYRTKKLSFNSRKRLLEDDDNDDVRSPLQKRRSIIEFSKELKTIRASRSRNIGCQCKDGSHCTKRCYCVKAELPCLYDMCGCECRGQRCREKHEHCVNELEPE